MHEIGNKALNQISWATFNLYSRIVLIHTANSQCRNNDVVVMAIQPDNHSFRACSASLSGVQCTQFILNSICFLFSVCKLLLMIFASTCMKDLSFSQNRVLRITAN